MKNALEAEIAKNVLLTSQLESSSELTRKQNKVCTVFNRVIIIIIINAVIVMIDIIVIVLLILRLVFNNQIVANVKKIEVNFVFILFSYLIVTILFYSQFLFLYFFCKCRN